MDYPLTVGAIARRAGTLWQRRPVVSRNSDGSLHRSTYGESLGRARRLASVLKDLGVRPGDRVATLCWNHHRHFEAYFATPLIGAVLHTLNLRLHPDELAYIAAHAEDRVLMVDRSLVPLLERFRDRTFVREVIVVSDNVPAPEGMLDYESLLATAPELDASATPEDEGAAAAMCYTSGTTGRPKAVVYSHRALVLHSMATAMPDSFSLGASDVVLAAINMFHANAWGIPYTAALTGAGLVLPGEHPDARTLLDLCHSEGVTFSAGVPTLWLGVLEALDASPGAWDLSRLRTIVIGGGAAPEGLVRGLEDRHGLRPITSWGMTEIAPVGTIGRLTPDGESLPPAEQHAAQDEGRSARRSARAESAQRGGTGSLGWLDDGRAGGAGSLRGVGLLSCRERRRLLYPGRLVPHRGRGDDRLHGVPRYSRPQQGPDQVRR